MLKPSEPSSSLRFLRWLAPYLLGIALVVPLHWFGGTPTGIRCQRSKDPGRQLDAASIKKNLVHKNYEVRFETVRLLETRNAFEYFQYVLPLVTSTNLELAWVARRFVSKCEESLRYYGWKEHTWGYQAPWGKVYTSNLLDACAVDVAADAVVSNYMAAMLATNWADINRLSDSGSMPEALATEREYRRFFLVSPHTFQLKRRVYTEEGVELEGLGYFPGLVTGMIASSFVLVPESNAWRVASILVDVPDDVADELLRD